METTLSPPSGKAVSNGTLGMSFLIATEMMLFAGFISAYLVNRAGAAWPPAGQPRLPVEITAMNTFILLASAFTIYRFAKNHSGGKGRKNMLLLTILLGLTFISIQGMEWIKLIQFGLTSTSSLYGAFFYTLIGAHGLHVIAGLLILFYLLFSITSSKKNSYDNIFPCSLYWYFVVGIWPVLYILVYLS